MDAFHMELPFYGQRKLRLELLDLGYKIGRKRVRWTPEFGPVAKL